MTMAGKARLRAGVKGALRLLTAAAGAVTTAQRGPRVLCYHGVCDDPPDEWSVTPTQLRAQMQLVATQYHPVALGELVRWLRGEVELPETAVAVTFDDGYRDVLTTAAPILREHGVPGTAFVAPGLLVGKGDPGFQATRPFLTLPEVRALRDAGFTIGSHALTHAPLAALSEAASQHELVESRRILESELGEPVRLLAYPFGTRRTVSERDHELARQAGYDAAFLDMTAPLRRGQPLWALPRSKVLHVDAAAVVRATLGGRLDLWRLVEAR